MEKTREMVVDFRRNGCVGELVIEGVIVEKVNEYKYLGTVLDNKLTFESNTNCIVKKCHQRMFCMFRLRSFGVSPKTLQMFYRSFNESVLTSSFPCWFGTLSVLLLYIYNAPCIRVKNLLKGANKVMLNNV